MAAYERIVNDAESVLSAAITSGATSLAVASAAKFPTDGVFRVRIDNEIIRVNSVSGTTFNVTRGVDGTVTASHVRGSQVAAIVTEDGFNRVLTERGFPMVPQRPPFRIADASGNILTSSDFTTDDPSGTMTVTDHTDGSITLKHDPFSVSEKISGLLRTMGSTYDITGAYRINTMTSGATEGGIFGPYLNRNSNNNRLVWRHRPFDDSSTFKWNVNHYIGSTFQTNVGTAHRFNHSPSKIHWFRLLRAGLDIEMYYSTDGVHFTKMYDQSENLHGGPADEAGIMIDNLTSYDAYITLLAWQE